MFIFSHQLEKEGSLISTDSKVIVSTSSKTDFQILGTLNIEEEGILVIENLFDLQGTINVNGKLELDVDNTIDGTLKVLDGGEANFKGDSYTFNENSKLEVHPNTLILQEPIELTIKGTYTGIGSITHSHGKLTFTSGSKVDTGDFIVRTDNELTFNGAEFKSLHSLEIETGHVTFDYDDTFESIDIDSIELQEGSVTFNNGDLKASSFTINSESTASASFFNTKLDSLTGFSSNNGNIEFNYEDDLIISAAFVLDSSDLDLTNSDTIYTFSDVYLLSSTRKGNGMLIVEKLSFSGTTFTGNSQTKCTENCDVINGETNIINVKDSHELIFDGNGNMDSESPLYFQINSATFILKEGSLISTDSKVIVSTSSKTDFQILGTLNIEEEGILVIENLFDLQGTINVNGKLELDVDNTIDGTLKVLDGGEANFKGDSYTFNENSKLEVHPNTLILQEPIELTIKGTYTGIGSITHSHGKLTFTSGSKVDTGDFIVRTDNELTFNGAEFKSLDSLEIETGHVTFCIDIDSIELQEGSVTFNNGDLKASSFTINSESTASASFFNTKLDSLTGFSSNNGNIEFNYEDDLIISAAFVLDSSDLDLTNSDTIYTFSDVYLLSSTRKGNGMLIVEKLSFSGTTFTGNSQTKCTESCDVINGETNIINVKDSHELIFDGNGNMDSESPLYFQINSATFILKEGSLISANPKVIVSTSSKTDFQILGTLNIEEAGILVIEDLFDLQGTINVNGKLELDVDNTIGGTLKVSDGGGAIFKGDSYTFNENSKLEVHPNTLTLQEPIELSIEGTYTGIGSITHSHGKLTFTSGSKVDTDDFIVKTDNELTFSGAEFKSLDSLEIETGHVTFDYDDTFKSIDIDSIELQEGSVTFNNGDLKASSFTINSESTASASFFNTKLDCLSGFTSIKGHLTLEYDDDFDITFDVDLENSELTLKNSVNYNFDDVKLVDSTRNGAGKLVAKSLSFANSEFAESGETICNENCQILDHSPNNNKLTEPHKLTFNSGGQISSGNAKLEILDGQFILPLDLVFQLDSTLIVSTSSKTDFQILGTLNIEEEGILVIENLFDLQGTINVNGKLELDVDNTIGGTLKVLDGGEAVLKGDSYTFNENSKLEVHPNTLSLQEPIELTIKGTYTGIGSITHSHGKLTFTSGSKVDTDDFIVKTDNELTFDGAEFKSLHSLEIETGHVTFDYDDTFESIDIDSIELQEGSVTFNNGDLKASSFTINSESTASASFFNTKLDSLSGFTSIKGHLTLEYDDDFDIAFDVDLENSELTLKNSVNYNFDDVKLIDSTRNGAGNLVAKSLSIANSEFAESGETICNENCQILDHSLNNNKISDLHKFTFNSGGQINSGNARLEILDGQFILPLDLVFQLDSTLIVSTSSKTDFQILGTLNIEEEGILVIEDLFDLQGTINVNGKLELDVDNTIGGTLKVLDGGEAIFKGDSYTFNENSKLEVHPNTLTLQEPIELSIEGTYTGIGSITHSHGKLTFTSGSKVDTDDFIVKTDNELTFNGAEFKSLDSLEIETGHVTFDYDDTFESIDIDSIELQEGSVTFNNGDLKASSFTINSESTASASFFNTKLDSLSGFSSNNGNIEFNYEDDLIISADFVLDSSDLDLTNSDTIYTFSDVYLLSSTRKGNGILIVGELSFSGTTFTGNSQTKCTESCHVINGETNYINQIRDQHKLLIKPDVIFSQSSFYLDSSSIEFNNNASFMEIEVSGSFDSTVEVFGPCYLNNASFLSSGSFDNSLLFRNSISCNNSVFEWTVDVQGDLTLNKGSSNLFSNELTIYSFVFFEADALMFINSIAYFLHNSNLTSDLGLILMENAEVYVSGFWTSPLNMLSLDNGLLVFDSFSTFTFDSINVFTSIVHIFSAITELVIVDLYNSTLLIEIKSSLFSIHNIYCENSKFTVSDVPAIVSMVQVHALNSEFSFRNLEPFLLIDELVSDGSTFNFNTGQLCVISNVSESNSLFTGADPYIFQDEQVFDVDINYGSSCCPTENCRIIIPFDYAWSVNDYLDVEVIGTQHFDLYKDGQKFDLLLSNIWGVDEQFNSILFNFTVNNQFVLTSFQFSLCPFTIMESSKPPTIGGPVIFSGVNFGSSLHPIYVTVDLLNITLNSVDFDHYSITFDVPLFSGCHNVTFYPTSRPNTEFEFCYQIPVISSLSPPLVPFSSDIVVSGFNLGDLLHFDLYISNTSFDFEPFTVSFSYAILRLIFVCTSSPKLNVAVVIGNQFSNFVEVELIAPSFKVFPSILPNSGGMITIEGNSFSKLFESGCLQHADVICSDGLVYFEPSRNHFDRISIGIYQLDELTEIVDCTVSFIPTINESFSIRIANIEAFPIEGVCFVDTECNVLLATVEGELDFTTLYPQVKEDSSMRIVSYIGHSNYSEVTFLPFTTKADLELCSNVSISCFSISNFPDIAEVISISPSRVMYFGPTTTTCVEITGTNFNNYLNFDNSFAISDFSITTSKVDAITVSACVTELLIGSYQLSTRSILSSSETDITIEILDPLDLPTLFTNSRAHIFFDSPSSVQIEISTLNFLINPGFNFLNLETLNECPVTIQVGDGSNSRLVLVDCIDSFEIQPTLFFVNVRSIVSIPVPDGLSGVFNLDCHSPLCIVGDTSIINSELSVLVEFSATGNFELSLSVSEGDNTMTKDFQVYVLPESIFQVISPLELFYYENVTVDVSVENFVSQGSFQWFIGLNLPATIHSISYQDSSTVVSLELPRVNSSGSFLFELYWNSPLFVDYEVKVSNFTVHRLSLESMGESLSPISSVDFCMYVDYYVSGFGLRCIIDDVYFLTFVDNDKICCKDAQTVRIQPTTNLAIVDSSSNVLDSIIVDVEPVFSDDCYVSNDPSLVKLGPSNLGFSHYYGDGKAIVDGVRCCSGPLNDCSIYFPSNSTLSINFDGEFDVRYITITVDSDCTSASRTTSPLEILHLYSDWSCHSIPNGFGFASQCITLFSELVVVESLELLAAQDVYLLEIEVNGFNPYVCLVPHNAELGVTSTGNHVDINSVIVYNNYFFSDYSSFLSNVSLGISEEISNVSFETLVFAEDCYFPEQSLTLNYDVQAPVTLDFFTFEITFTNESITVDVECKDVLVL
ncbi:hypothetical protein P9112_012441 [Eukaryota sp. TZLM1-RC]